MCRLKTRGKNYQYGETVHCQGKEARNPKYGQEFTLIVRV